MRHREPNVIHLFHVLSLLSNVPLTVWLQFKRKVKKYCVTVESPSLCPHSASIVSETVSPRRRTSSSIPEGRPPPIGPPHLSHHAFSPEPFRQQPTLHHTFWLCVPPTNPYRHSFILNTPQRPSGIDITHNHVDVFLICSSLCTNASLYLLLYS